MRFNCTSCGECCRNLAASIEYIKGGVPMELPGVDLEALVEEFPYKTDHLGACEKFQNDRCSVYDERPTFCNYQKIYERFPEAADTIEDWYIKMMSNCNFLIRIAQRPQEFIIKKPYLTSHGTDK